MESSSKALPSASARLHDFEYLYASNTNVSNFVSVKLSGNNNYHVWKSQMLCLLGSNNMRCFVDPTFVGPRNYDKDTARQYDCLAKGWILGSVSEDILSDVHNLDSAKDVWKKLESTYDPPTSSKEASKKSDRVEEYPDLTDIRVDKNDENKKKDDESKKKDDESKEKDDENKETDKMELRKFTINGDWKNVETILKRYDGRIATEAISSDGSTVLHLAVGIGQNLLVKNLLSNYKSQEMLLQTRHTDGSTPLHIAAIVGNKHLAAELVKNNQELLHIKDKAGNEPLQKAFEFMHLDTIWYLLKVRKDDSNKEGKSSPVSPKSGDYVKLLVNAISAKDFSLAIKVLNDFPQSASEPEDVLMAIAKSFPRGLDSWETLIYPTSLANILWLLLLISAITVCLLGSPAIAIWIIVRVIKDPNLKFHQVCLKGFLIFIVAVIAPFAVIVLTVCVIFLSLNYIWWKFAAILFPPIKHMENKKKKFDDATKVLKLACDAINKLGYSGTHHYTSPLLEAACHNAYKVVDEILSRSPEAIESKDKNGYDIIQLAIINRSEKVYNLIYNIGERKTLYRIYEDSSGNNLLHLAGRLAPPGVLNVRTGAALQLQRELQWREEVKKFVFPTYITKENKEKKTPDMVFRTAHETLVKEGEQWMKTTAESCSITAALITTIVFAAAITVPGGNDGIEGTPLFRKRTAFIIFAVSDAISLFASSTALLVFLSILTTRFAEKDFLVSLPRRLFIGLLSLLVSTITMMTAFSATLYLVFGDQKQWMLGPICGLALIPIIFFVGLQFPLMVDLFSSTYIGIFGKRNTNIRFDDMRLRFGTIEGNIRQIVKKKGDEQQEPKTSPT